MKRLTLILVSLSIFSCTSKKENKAPPAAHTGETSGEETVDGTFGTTLTEINTGYDGTGQYTLFLPGRTEYQIKDTAIATLEGVTVTLSAETIWELISAQKQKDPSFDEEAFRKIFPTSQTAYRLIPLKAGSTTMMATKNGNTTEIKLNVVQYPDNAPEIGKARYYNTEGTGKKRACISCHGGEGAPSHAMGRVMQINDAEALQWITTGKVRDRVARVTHTWEFDSAEESTGVIAYLRTLQTDDVEALTKMMFESEYADFLNESK